MLRKKYDDWMVGERATRNQTDSPTSSASAFDAKASQATGKMCGAAVGRRRVVGDRAGGTHEATSCRTARARAFRNRGRTGRACMREPGVDVECFMVYLWRLGRERTRRRRAAERGHVGRVLAGGECPHGFRTICASRACFFTGNRLGICEDVTGHL